MQYLLDPLGYLAIFSNVLIIYVLVLLFRRGKENNLYLVIYFTICLLHQLFIQLQLFEVLNLQQFGRVTISLILLYPPTHYLYLNKYFGNSTDSPLLHYFTWQVVYGLLLTLLYFEVYRVPQLAFILLYLTPTIGYFALSIHAFLNTSSDQYNKAWVIIFLLGVGSKVVMLVVEGVALAINLIWVLQYFGSYIVLINFILVIVLCIAFLYQTIHHPKLFTKAECNTGTAAEPLDSEIELLTEYVVRRKMFLESDLTRAKLTKQIGLSPQRISEVVNSHFKMKFNDWINDLRINLAQDLLHSSDQTIKEVYFKIGYSSKSVFNSAFKKRTGETPTDYRKRLKLLNTEVDRV
ncbi:MAG: AraC family transcriptional regulator [Reichenbachiella sp.]|uniref:AraC family transcriptional regulator n=1 Tax=Reichenbachiella sp. TaxID=2184521 RepID=UPI00329A30B5